VPQLNLSDILKALVEPTTISAILLFVLPGFVAFKLDQQLRPQIVRSALDSIVEIVAYSVVNDLLWSPLYRLGKTPGLPTTWQQWVLALVVLIVSPAILTILYARAVDWLAARGIVPSPTPKPWDHFFDRVVKAQPSRQVGVILTLRDASRIAGVYKQPAFASSFPTEEQLYLAESWALDKDGGFGERAEATLGLLIDKSDILLLEFFEWPLPLVRDTK